MPHKDAFSACHPLVGFLYFALVMLFPMCMHPGYLGVSLLSALGYGLHLRGKKALLRQLKMLLPLLFLAMLLPPLFSHEGATILGYLPTGNPLTLESLAYSSAAAFLLVSMVAWLFCYQEIMTTDKLVCLFGRILPVLSLLFSMTLRFVPLFAARCRMVADAQQGIGRSPAGKNLFQKIRFGLNVFSIALTWSLENAIETADSMKSRGYGLPGRTAFSVYRWDARDKAVLLWMLSCAVYVFSGWLVGGAFFRYYPTLKGTGWNAFSFSFLAAYGALCLTPLLLDKKEEKNWTFTPSNN